MIQNVIHVPFLLERFMLYYMLFIFTIKCTNKFCFKNIIHVYLKLVLNTFKSPKKLFSGSLRTAHTNQRITIHICQPLEQSQLPRKLLG